MSNTETTEANVERPTSNIERRMEDEAWAVGDAVRIVAEGKHIGWRGTISHIEPDHKADGFGDLLFIQTANHTIPVFENEIVREDGTTKHAKDAK